MPPRSKMLRPAVAAPLLVTTAALLLLLAVAQGAWRLVGEPFPGFLAWDNGVLVSLHLERWTGAQAELPLNGGILEAIDGEPLGAHNAPIELARRAPLKTLFHYDVRLNDEVKRFAVPSMRFGALDFASTFGIYLFNAMALIGVAIVCLRLRPDLPAARALALSTGMLGALLLLAVDFVTAYRMTFLCRAAEAAAPASLALLALRFPSEIGTPALRRGLVVGLAALGFAMHLGAAEVSPEWARTSATLVYAAIATALLALLLNCVSSLRNATSAHRRVVAGIVLAGWLPAFALAAAGILAFLLFGWSFSWAWVFVLLPLAPATTAYAILRHDLFQAERLARISTGYTIATSLIFLVFAASLTALERLFVRGVGANPIAALLLLFALAIAFDPLRRRIQRAIDRFFYRAQVDVAHELETSSVELATIESETTIASTLEARLEHALRPTWAQVSFHPPEAERAEAGEGTTEGDAANSARRPTAPTTGLPAHAASIEEPVRFGEHTIGRIACGEKRSGAPWSPDERELLKGFAAQAALAIRSVRARESLRAAERELLRNAQLAAVGEFAGTVAHGIRNPVAGIRAAAQVAQRELQVHPGSTEGEQRVARSLEGVVEEADRLEQRIRALLEFSRTRDHRFDTRDLATVLESVAANLSGRAQRSGVTLEIEAPRPALQWRIDEAQLVEALLELGTNAIRSMPQGGHLRFAARREGERVAIEIEDSGGGISTDASQRIFELSYTTRSDGMGMGLTRARQIAEAHGGSLALLRSGPEGSLFRLLLAPIEA